MLTMGCVSGQMYTKTMVSGQFDFISLIYLQLNDLSSSVTEGLYTVKLHMKSEIRKYLFDHNTYIQWFIMKVMNIEVKDDFC